MFFFFHKKINNNYKTFQSSKNLKRVFMNFINLKFLTKVIILNTSNNVLLTLPYSINFFSLIIYIRA